MNDMNDMNNNGPQVPPEANNYGAGVQQQPGVGGFYGYPGYAPQPQQAMAGMQVPPPPYPGYPPVAPHYPGMPHMGYGYPSPSSSPMYQPMPPVMPYSQPVNNTAVPPAPQSAADEAASANSPFGNIGKMLDFEDKDFWKGAMVGAAAVMILSNESVQQAILRTGSKVRDKMKSGADSLRDQIHKATDSADEGSD